MFLFFLFFFGNRETLICWRIYYISLSLKMLEFIFKKLKYNNIFWQFFFCYFCQMLEITDFFYKVKPFQYTSSWINLYNLAQFFICTNFRGLFYFFILLFAIFLFSASTMSLIIRKFKALSWFLRLKFRKSRFLKLRFPLLRYNCFFTHFDIRGPTTVLQC